MGSETSKPTLVYMTCCQKGCVTEYVIQNPGTINPACTRCGHPHCGKCGVSARSKDGAGTADGGNGNGKLGDGGGLSCMDGNCAYKMC